MIERSPGADPWPRPHFRAILRAFAWIFTRCGLVLTFAGPLIFCAQCLVGLKRGVWPSLDFQTLFGATAEPGTIAATLSGIPVWIAILIVGCVSLYFGIRISRALDARMLI
jgi:hypothetical protein